MNIKDAKAVSLFADKTTRILRALLASPQFKWHTRSLAAASHTSLGLVSRTIGTLDQLGLVESGGLGRGGYMILKDADALLNLWTDHYDFIQNKVSSFYIADPKDVQKFFQALNHHSIRYALTLHSGANLLTHYFATDQHHLYIDIANIEKLVIQLSSSISIQRLAKGGNLHLITPYYKNSIFDRMHHIQKKPVVSNLQLYLDLFHFFPRGHDHAVQLRNILGDKIYE